VRSSTLLAVASRKASLVEGLTVKLKMIFVDHYFCPHQTPKNAKIIFWKPFYTETNEA